jgi:hypothetical protein
MVRRKAAHSQNVHHRGESVDSFAHVAVAQGQMHFDAGRNDHHEADSRCATYCRTDSGSAPSGAKTMRPSVSSTAIVPGGCGSRFCTSIGAFIFGRPRAGVSITRAVTSSGCSFGFIPNWLRQRKIIGAVTRCRSATEATVTPGSAASVTMANFCWSVNWRRLVLDAASEDGRAVSAAVVSVRVIPRSCLNSYLNSYLNSLPTGEVHGYSDASTRASLGLMGRAQARRFQSLR